MGEETRTQQLLDRLDDLQEERNKLFTQYDKIARMLTANECATEEAKAALVDLGS